MRRSRSPRRGGEHSEEITLFVAENGIDKSGEEALRGLNTELLRIVVDEGPVSGKNPSAVLIGRIKRARATVAANGIAGSGYPGIAASIAAAAGAPPLINGQPTGVYAMRHMAFQMPGQVLGFPGPPPGAPPQLQAMVSGFIEENSLDDSARVKLQAQPVDVQQAVVAEGPLTGRNPSAVLASRIRRAAEGRSPALPTFAQPIMYEYPTHQPPPPSAPPPAALQALLQPGRVAAHSMSAFKFTASRRSNSPLSKFIADNLLDQNAEHKLRQQQPYVQQRVLSEGPLTGRNPSAVLLSRIRRIQEEDPLAAAPNPGEDVMQVATDLLGEGGTPMGPDSASLLARAKRLAEAEPGSLEARVEVFSAEHGLDDSASRALREAPPDVQTKVMDEGPLTGRNPSAVMLSRLKRANPNAPRPTPEEAVLAFAEDHRLDENARLLLWSQPENVQQAVIEEGPLTGRNASAVLGSRIRRILDGTGPTHSVHGQSPPPPMSHPPLEILVAGFATENALDDAARTQLFSQAPDVQQAILAEGPLTGRNPSAVLFGRIKRLMQGGGIAASPMLSSMAISGYGPTYLSYGGALPSVTPIYPIATRLGGDAISRFVQENGLDAQAEQKLRDQPPHVQQQVLAEGGLSGRNTSAVLTGRIRRILETGSGRGTTQATEEEIAMRRAAAAASDDPVDAFAFENGLDEGAVKALREAPRDVQQKVVDEGNITGRNPNAIVMSRIRRAQKGS